MLFCTYQEICLHQLLALWFLGSKSAMSNTHTPFAKITSLTVFFFFLWDWPMRAGRFILTSGKLYLKSSCEGLFKIFMFFVCLFFFEILIWSEKKIAFSFQASAEALVLRGMWQKHAQVQTSHKSHRKALFIRQNLICLCHTQQFTNTTLCTSISHPVALNHLLTHLVSF